MGLHNFVLADCFGDTVREFSNARHTAHRPPNIVGSSVHGPEQIVAQRPVQEAWPPKPHTHSPDTLNPSLVAKSIVCLGHVTGHYIY